MTDTLANIQTPDGKPVAGAEVGNTRSLRHGAYAVAVIQPRAQVIADALREDVPARSDSDDWAIVQLAHVLAQIEAFETEIARVGIAKAKPSILKNLTAARNTAARAYDALGLTPTARARLGVDHRKGAALEMHIRKTYGDEIPND